MRRDRFGRASDARSPRIAVVGNCQNFGIAYGMQLLMPQAHVDRFTIVRKGLASLQQLANVLKTYDYVFSLDFPDGYLRGGAWTHLLDLVPGATAIPSIVFSGFHPDAIYVADPANGRTLEAAAGPYHSAIAAFAFLRGFSLEQTQSLFADNFFEALGYYDLWEPAQAEFFRLTRQRDLDLSNEFARWCRGAPFMYSINHPKPFVLFDLARVLLRKKGLKVSDAPFEHFTVDDVSQGVIYPIYPEIAERYGWQGAYLFKQANYNLKFSVGEFYDLPTFLKKSFAAYQRFGAARLGAPRLDEWRNDPEVGRLFDYFAAENLAARYR
jgi:hypothetical protein